MAAEDKAHNITIGIDVGGRHIQASQSYAGDGNESVEADIAADASDVEVTIGIDYDKLKSIFIMADQDLTLETNSGDAADDTLTLKAKSPISWNADSDYDNPFTADVTSIFVTNNSDPATATVLYIERLQDVTP